MHNLYFPYIRIILMIILFYGLYLLSFQRQKVEFLIENPEVTEKDLEEYQLERVKWNQNIQYLKNGENRYYGNLLGMEPYFLPLDFYSEENFYNSLKPLFEKAQLEKAIDRKTLVVLPEHTGTGLVLLGEKKYVFEAKSMEQLLDLLYQEFEKNKNFQNQILPFIQDEFQEKLKNKKRKELTEIEFIQFIQAVFRFKSPTMAKAYNSVFSRLAKEYNVSILAGSIVLENPDIVQGNLVSSSGDLYNVSVAFIGNGTCVRPLFKKSVLSEWEEGILQPGKRDQEKILRVPAWTVGVFLSEESQEEEFYKKIGNSQKLDGIVSPASAFQIFKTKPNTNKYLEIQNEFQSTWDRKGIHYWIQNTRAKDHIQVFWKGELWNIIPLGESYTYRSLETKVKSGKEWGPKILNIYY